MCLFRMTAAKERGGGGGGRLHLKTRAEDANFLAGGNRLNGSVTFDRRKSTSPVLTKFEATQANQFVDWLIELTNRGFGLSKGAFLTALEKKRAGMSKTI